MRRPAGGRIPPPAAAAAGLRGVWIHWRREGSGGGLLIACGGLVRLNRAAAAVWEEIARGVDRATLHRRMRRRYAGVDDATLRAQIDSLLDRWLEEDWITPVEDPVFPAPEGEWAGGRSTLS